MQWVQFLRVLCTYMTTDLSSSSSSSSSSSHVTGLSFPVILLNQQWSPPLRLQVSHCSTFRITCDVPSIAVFCSESIECFPGTASKFFLKLLVTIPLVPIISGIILHFRFHISFIYIPKLLYCCYYNYYHHHLCRILLRCRHLRLYSVEWWDE
jgi:hypothetical protein